MTRVLVDTNLLLLHMLGRASRDNIGRHKRLKSFSDFEFELLEKLMKGASGFVTTPHILAEVSNLLGIGKNAHVATVDEFCDFVESSEEISTGAADVISKPEFVRFGLTDTVIQHIANDGIVVLTVDRPLSGSLSLLGLQVYNLRHAYDLNG